MTTRKTEQKAETVKALRARGYTRTDVARIYGLSNERIRQLENTPRKQGP